MEVVSITPGVTYPTAVELPNKNHRFVNGSNKSSSGNSTSKNKNRLVLPGKLLSELQKASQEQTKANQRVLVIDGGKRRWVLLSDWRAREQEGNG